MMAQDNVIIDSFEELSAAFKVQGDPKTVIKLWRKHLADYSNESVKMATDQWISQEKWFPKLSEFTALCKMIQYNKKQERRSVVLAYNQLKIAASCGEFSPSAWLDVMSEMERLDLVHMKVHAENTYQHWRKLYVTPTQ